MKKLKQITIVLSLFCLPFALQAQTKIGFNTHAFSISYLHPVVNDNPQSNLYLLEYQHAFYQRNSLFHPTINLGVLSFRHTYVEELHYNIPIQIGLLYIFEKTNGLFMTTNVGTSLNMLSDNGKLFNSKLQSAHFNSSFELGYKFIMDWQFSSGVYMEINKLWYTLKVATCF